MRKLAEGSRDKLKIEAAGKADAIRLEGQAEADVVLLKAQAEAEALRLLAAALQNNKDLINLRFVDKIAPNLRVMLLPSNNPFLFSLPDLENNWPHGSDHTRGADYNFITNPQPPWRRLIHPNRYPYPDSIAVNEVCYNPAILPFEPVV